MKRTFLLCLSVVLAGHLLCPPAPAHAGHGEDSAITDGMPQVLAPGEWRLGLWKLQYGLPGKLAGVQLGTYTMPWTLWIASARLINGQIKYEFWSNDRWSLGAELGLFYLDLENLDAPVTLTVVPMDAYASYRISENVLLGLRGTYTAASIEGSYDEEEVGAFQGAVAASTAQAAATLIWHRSRLTAFSLEARLSHIFGLAADVDATLQVDDYTRVDLVGTGESDVIDLTGGSVTGRVHWSWDYFNLRLGLTYGNYNFGGVNFVVPTAIVFPDIDLFWRF